MAARAAHYACSRVTTIEIVIAFVLIAANAFFVAGEFAITRVRPTQADEWLANGRPGARSVSHAVDHIDSYLAASQLGITLASLGLGVVGEKAFHSIFDDVLGDSAEVAGIGIASALSFALITLLHVTMGELAPKSAAIARTDPLVLLVAPPMRGFYLLTKPVVDLFNGLGNLLLKPFGIPRASEAGHAPHTEDELRALVRESAGSGLIQPEEGQFTDNVFTFGDRRAREVMVPRPEVQVVTTDQTLDDAVARIRDTGLTRLPLCRPEGGLDSAVGIIHAKDLLVAVAAGEPSPLEAVGRPVDHVPESLLIDELLEQLRRQREHLAIVVDEHGTAVGIVTLEDVLEEIVGEIEDEFDPQVPEDVREVDGELRISGNAPVREVAELLGVTLDEVHEATMSGWVIEQLGRMPTVGEHVSLDGADLEVVRLGDARVDELRAASPRPEPADG
jgi:CBS domain containing-hemolysin-like protein